jgi:hypothetical protein
MLGHDKNKFVVKDKEKVGGQELSPGVKEQFDNDVASKSPQDNDFVPKL